MALVTTVGGSTSNSYNSLAEGAAYATARGWTDWLDTDVTDATREGLMVQATQRLDLLDLAGDRASAEQALRFPRIGLYDRDGFAVSSTIIPVQVKSAHMELARTLLDDAASTGGGGTSSGLGGLSEVQVGPVRVKAGSTDVPTGPTYSAAKQAADEDPIVRLLMAPFLLFGEVSVAAGAAGHVELLI